MPTSKRILAALSLGYILQFWSELVFSPAPALASPADPVIAWLLYGVLAYALLCVIDTFRVATLPMLLVAGAVYGWMREGVVTDAMFLDLPLSIAWPALPWHSLVGVCVGWYGVTRALQAKRTWVPLLTCVGLGLGWGAWAAARASRSGDALDVATWLGEALLATGFLIAAHWLFVRSHPHRFAASIEERWAIGSLAAAFFLIARASDGWQPLLVGPTCFGAALFLLRRSRTTDQRVTVLHDLAHATPAGRYITLAVLPVSAAVVYATAPHVDLHALLTHAPHAAAGLALTLIAGLLLLGVASLAPDQKPDKSAVLA